MACSRPWFRSTEEEGAGSAPGIGGGTGSVRPGSMDGRDSPLAILFTDRVSHGFTDGADLHTLARPFRLSCSLSSLARSPPWWLPQLCRSPLRSCVRLDAWIVAARVSFITRVRLPPGLHLDLHGPHLVRWATHPRVALGTTPSSSRLPSTQAMREERQCTAALGVEPLDEPQVRRLAPASAVCSSSWRVGARPPRLGLD